MMVGQRLLSFDRLDEVMPEVDRLLLGHLLVGGWTLGQILSHLGTAVGLCLEGDRISGEPVDPEMARVHAVRRRYFFRSSRFPEGQEIPHPSMLPDREADERAEAERLRSALARLEMSEGPFASHPILGALSKDEWTRFHRIHCAHHLGFALPTSWHPD